MGAAPTGILDFLSEDKTMYCCTKVLLERAEQDGETIRRAAHRSRCGLEIELTKRTVPS